MNDLIQSGDWLNRAMQADPVLCLAQTVAWLDPYWRGYDDEIEHDAEGFLQAALLVTREHFPRLYVDAIHEIRKGSPYNIIDHLICEGITDYGIPLSDLEYIPYGIPVPAYGVLLDDPEFYVDHPRCVPVLALFGITPEPNAYTIEIPEIAYRAAAMIASDLEERPEEPYRHVAWLLRWLYGMSGNSVIDWDLETLSEVEPLAWDDLDFALTMITEADEIMADALAGLDWLTQTPQAMQDLQHNIQTIYQAYQRAQKRGQDDDNARIRLKWTGFTSSNA